MHFFLPARSLPSRETKTPWNLYSETSFARYKIFRQRTTETDFDETETETQTSTIKTTTTTKSSRFDKKQNSD